MTTERDGDSPRRIGPVRLMALGAPASRALRAAIACVAVGVLVAFSLPSHEGWTTVVRASTSGTPVSLGARPALCAALRRPSGAARVVGTLTANSLEGHPNVFQTAPVNAGIRLELAADGRAGVVVSDGRAGETFGGLSSTAPVRSGVATHFAATVRRDGRLTLEIGDSRLDGTMRHPKPRCSAVEVGTGFDAERQLDGTVEDAVFQTSNGAPRKSDLAGVARVLALATLVWLVAATFPGLAKERAEQSQERGG